MYKRAIKQYFDAEGYADDTDAVIKWLKERQMTGVEYKNFLDYLGINYNSSSYVETDKSSIDSVFLPNETTLITPFIKKGSNHKYKTIIDGRLVVYSKLPWLLRTEEMPIILPKDVLTTYMTQNPYDHKKIHSWEDLHNSEENNIVVGMYGNIFDKDRESKIKMLEELKSKLERPYVYEQATIGDKYVSVLFSPLTKERVKVKVKVKTKEKEEEKKFIDKLVESVVEEEQNERIKTR